VKIIRNPKDGDSLDATLTMYPSRLEVVEGRREVGDVTTTSYGYVATGTADICTPRFRLQAAHGTFFSVPGTFSVESRGRVVLIQRLGYRGLVVAGRLEDVGRLAYIDGCSSTILVSPARVGDPVLNHLHIPPGTDQSQHTHPSVRLGVITRGSGMATGRGAAGEGWEEPLEAGTVFLLDAQELHSFSTAASRDGLDVVTYHPDSDWGPTDGDHPMVSRTYLRPKK
jgi:hypothetical protein